MELRTPRRLTITTDGVAASTMSATKLRSKATGDGVRRQQLRGCCARSESASTEPRTSIGVRPLFGLPDRRPGATLALRGQAPFTRWVWPLHTYTYTPGGADGSSDADAGAAAAAESAPGGAGGADDGDDGDGGMGQTKKRKRKKPSDKRGGKRTQNQRQAEQRAGGGGE